MESFIFSGGRDTFKDARRYVDRQGVILDEEADPDIRNAYQVTSGLVGGNIVVLTWQSVAGADQVEVEIMS